jgi:hypothetical protein
MTESTQGTSVLRQRMIDSTFRASGRSAAVPPREFGMGR